MKIIDTVLKIKTDTLPPKNSYIEAQIKTQGIDPIRWAVVDVKDNILIVSVAGYKA